MNNILNIQIASLKAGDMMTYKYGEDWIVKTIIDGETNIEIKPEYIEEFDNLYNKFLNI